MRAVRASKAFAVWLRRGPLAHPRGTYAIGAANYAARLRYEEALTLPLPAYLRLGENALSRTHREMVAVAHRIDPHATVGEVIARLSRVHPSSAGLLAAASGDLVGLRRFIVNHRLLALPADANISVKLTPVFERQMVVAQLDAPGALERRATAAFYNVTPVDPRDTPQNQERYLETFNAYERPIVSAHEVYPGHYVNFMIDRHSPLSLTERLTWSTSFGEGWAHYCEQMIVQVGWGGGDPRVHLMQLKEAILRNARFVVGVKLHTQGMTLAQGIAFFEYEAFLDPADARIETRRGTEDATYGYYTLGKLEILKLREDYRRKMGSRFTLARFHAALLAYGDPPAPLLRPMLLGKDDRGTLIDPALER